MIVLQVRFEDCKNEEADFQSDPSSFLSARNTFTKRWTCIGWLSFAPLAAATGIMESDRTQVEVRSGQRSAVLCDFP